MSERYDTMMANDAVVQATLDDEAVLLNVETGTYYGLDPVGTRIWNLLSESASTETIINELHSEYEVPMVQLRRDIDDFVQLLTAKGLVLGTQE